MQGCLLWADDSRLISPANLPVSSVFHILAAGCMPTFTSNKKKIMKKLILQSLFVLTMVILYSRVTQAQPPAGELPMGPPPELNNRLSTNEEKEISRLQVDWMKKKLKLNKEQQQAAKKITLDHAKKILVLKKKEGYKGPSDPGKQQADLERDEAMKKMLTEKQFSRFTKNKHILENSFDNFQGGGIPPPPGM